VSGVVVGIDRVAARLANEMALALTVRLRTMSTPGASARRVTWVYTDDKNPFALGLVVQERAELMETPPMEQTPLRGALAAAVTDTGEGFKG
jgi:hypothetical protein